MKKRPRKIAHLGLFVTTAFLHVDLAWAQSPCEIHWQSDSLLLPDEYPSMGSPGFTEIITGLGSGAFSSMADYLVINTPNPGDRFGYGNQAPEIALPPDDPASELIVDFRVKVTNSAAGSVCPDRKAVTVTVDLPDPTGVYALRRLGIWIGTDEIRRPTAHGNPCGTSEPLLTLQPPDLNYHDYRIVVTNPASSTPTYTVTRDYDPGDPATILIAGAAMFPVDHGDTQVTPPRITWGSLSQQASGTSHWESFSHNVRNCDWSEPVGCTPVANSTGQIGELSVSGSNIASENNLTLVASNLPQDKVGMFFTSQGLLMPPQTLLGSPSLLCLSNVRRYLPAQSTGAGGQMSLTLDLNNVPPSTHPDTTMSAGETWYFQAWFRDPINLMGTPYDSNLTRALTVHFY